MFLETEAAEIKLHLDGLIALASADLARWMFRDVPIEGDVRRFVQIDIGRSVNAIRLISFGMQPHDLAMLVIVLDGEGGFVRGWVRENFPRSGQIVFASDSSTEIQYDMLRVGRACRLAGDKDVQPQHSHAQNTLTRHR